MADHFFKKALGSALIPSTEEAREWLDTIKTGEILRIKASQPRNIKHHAKFFALLTLIYKNQTHYKSVDDILLAFKYQIGHGHWVLGKKAGMQVELFQPHSISFAKMDQAAFNEFYSKAIDFVTTVVIPGLHKGDLERELMEFAA